MWPSLIAHILCWIGFGSDMDTNPGSAMVLQPIFGITQSSLSDYLKFCTHILIYVLQQLDDARVKRPDAAKVREYQNAVQCCHLLLSEVWCTS